VGQEETVLVSGTLGSKNYARCFELLNRQEFQRSQLTELASTDFESWAKESFEIATKFAYRNGGRIGIPKGGAMDCTMVAAAPVLPVGHVANASRIGDRRMMLAGYRLLEVLKQVLGD
jgi:hypothetical protein